MKVRKIILCIALIATVVLSTITTYATSISISEENNEETLLNFDEGTISKKITNIENNEITIEYNLKVTDNKLIGSDTEVLLLIDDSSSMNTVLEDNVTTRKNKVINSAMELINKINNNNPNVKIGVMSFSSTTKVVQEFTTDKNELLNSCIEFNKKAPSGNTNMSTAISAAKQKFSPNIQNKILILLTDGFPTDGEHNTKNNLKDENVYIITTLVGLNTLDTANNDKIKNIFGTELTPTANRFYNISDNDIETIINNNIYNTIVEYFKSSINNIVIKDYIPEDIINNFDITIENKSKGEILNTENAISWLIDNLNISESASLVCKLKLKDTYNEDIIGKTLNTSQKIELSYNSMMGNDELKTIINSPKINIISKEIIEEDNSGEIINEDNSSGNGTGSGDVSSSVDSSSGDGTGSGAGSSEDSNSGNGNVSSSVDSSSGSGTGSSSEDSNSGDGIGSGAGSSSEDSNSGNGNGSGDVSSSEDSNSGNGTGSGAGSGNEDSNSGNGTGSGAETGDEDNNSGDGTESETGTGDEDNNSGDGTGSGDGSSSEGSNSENGDGTSDKDNNSENGNGEGSSNENNNKKTRNNSKTSTKTSSKNKINTIKTTTANTEIPYTGSNKIVLLGIILGIISSIILKKKINSIDK